MYHLDTPVLETERLVLHAPQLADWEPLAAFLASDRAQYVGGPLTRDRAWRGFGHLVGHWVLRGYGMFFITPKGSDTAIGMVGPWYPEGWPEREIGWSMFDADAEGKGYAFEAAMAAKAHVFADLGWKTAVSYIDRENSRSIALALRLGARLDPEAATIEGEKVMVYRHAAPDRVHPLAGRSEPQTAARSTERAST